MGSFLQINLLTNDCHTQEHLELVPYCRLWYQYYYQLPPDSVDETPSGGSLKYQHHHQKNNKKYMVIDD